MKKECPTCGSVYSIFDLPKTISECCHEYFKLSKIVTEFVREEKAIKYMIDGSDRLVCPVCESKHSKNNVYPSELKNCCINMIKEWQKYNLNKCEKPPLGLVPAKTFYALRLKDINEAIERYVEFGKDIPFEWIREKNMLEEYLN